MPPQSFAISGSTALYGSAVVLMRLGCDSDTILDDSCFVDLAPVSPSNTALSVGDTVTFIASLGPAECLPTGVDTEEWRWSTTDTLIVRIDSLTGLAQGIGSGEAVIEVHHAENSEVRSSAVLTVLANEPNIPLSVIKRSP